MDDNVIASALTDPTQLLALPFVLIQQASTFAVSMLRQAADFGLSIFELML